MSTLIGGTEPSSNRAGSEGASICLGFLSFFFLSGRGDATREVGGDEECRTMESVGAGGVGMGAVEDAECFASDAEES